jgi:hypothetical protein
MARSTRQFCDVWLVVLLAVVATGCTPKTDPPALAPLPAAGQTPPQPVVDGPSEVELSEPRVSFRDATTVLFEVKYRFTKGRPSGCYSCVISFPGHPDRAEKRMESWEMKQEGVIEDGATLAQPGATTFEIHLSEAPSQRGPFKKVSNVVSGPVKLTPP